MSASAATRGKRRRALQENSASRRRRAAEAWRASFDDDGDSDSDSDLGVPFLDAAASESGSGSERGSGSESGSERASPHARICAGAFYRLRQGVAVCQLPWTRALAEAPIARVEHLSDDGAVVCSIAVPVADLQRVWRGGACPPQIASARASANEVVLLGGCNLDLDPCDLDGLVSVDLAVPSATLDGAPGYHCYRLVEVSDRTGTPEGDENSVRLLLECTAPTASAPALWHLYRGQPVTDPSCEFLRELRLQGLEGCLWYGGATAVCEPLRRVANGSGLRVRGDCAYRGRCDACHRLRLLRSYDAGGRMLALGRQCARKLRSVDTLQSALRWHRDHRSGAVDTFADVWPALDGCRAAVLHEP
jgi:hypothetical protein